MADQVDFEVNGLDLLAYTAATTTKNRFCCQTAPRGFAGCGPCG